METKFNLICWGKIIDIGSKKKMKKERKRILKLNLFTLKGVDRNINGIMISSKPIIIRSGKVWESEISIIKNGS